MEFSSDISRRKLLRYMALTAAAATAATVSPLFTRSASAVVSLSGAGATFPALLFERYFNQFNRENPDIRVSYQPIGSGGGIRQTIAQTVDFGASDAAMTDAQIEQVGDRGIILVPTAGGSVVIVYNLPGVTNLRLPRAVYPDIFSGRITRWNDPRLVQANPGVNLPDLPIRPTVRADGSGTTFIFVNNLSAVNPYFRGRIGVGTAPRWTTNPLTGRGNAGVAAQVQRTNGSIGYVEFAYARQNNLQTALVENKAGQFIAPSLEQAELALSRITFPDNFRVFEGDPASGYPITGLTWIMVYKQYEEAGKAAAIKELVRWMLTDGQEINNTLDYTRIPDDVVQRVIQTVESGVTGP